MLKILFVILADSRAHHAAQVHNLANQLARFGHRVLVGLSTKKQSPPGERLYSTTKLDGFNGFHFPKDEAPDLVHVWPPHHQTRLFCEQLRQRCWFHLIVHLDESVVSGGTSGSSELSLAATNESENSSSTTHNEALLLEQASGVTLVMDGFGKVIPPAIPRMLLWPGVASEVFYPRPKDGGFLIKLRVAVNSTVISYTGDVHAENARQVRSLYLAVAMLNREQMPTTLLRTGRDYHSFLSPEEQWARKYSVELGDVKEAEVARVLGTADFLIQPGMPDAWSEYRLPEKLPQFFAMGRPVILPRSNVGRFAKHGVHAWVLPKADALGIVEAVKHLRDKEPLLRQLSEGAVQFCRQHFDWETNARKLEQFYKSLLDAPSSSAQDAGGYGNKTWSAESSTGENRGNEVTRGEARRDLPRAP